jgi:hypothetical protein
MCEALENLIGYGFVGLVLIGIFLVVAICWPFLKP